MYKSKTDVEATVAPADPKTYRYDITDSVIYVGKAPPGTTESSIGWTIAKIERDESGVATSKLVTDTGVATWTNRTNETYK